MQFDDHSDSFDDDDDTNGLDHTDQDLTEEPSSDPASSQDKVTHCPNCKQPFFDYFDSCPYCGDIIFRYLRDGSFSPPKGPLVKVVAFLIFFLVFLAVVGLILRLIIP